jgi:hypothetical protein
MLRIFLNLTILQNYPGHFQTFGNIAFPLFAQMIGKRSLADAGALINSATPK